MSQEARIPFPDGLMTHQGVVFEVVIRPPSFDEYMELGEIDSYGKAPDGTLFMVENGEVLRAYLVKCVVQPRDPLALGQGGMKLARAVKGAVKGFFRDEPSREEPSPTSPTTSSSDAAKDASMPTPSAG